MAAGAGFTLGDLAAALGVVLEGDPLRRVTGVSALDSAGPDQISFVTDPRYGDAARTSRAGAFLAGPDITGLAAPVLRAARPQQALIELLTLFHPPRSATPGIDASARVAADATVEPSASIGPLAVVESGAVIGPRVRVDAPAYVGPGVEIGEDSVIHPHVTLAEGVRLGCRVIVHPGAVIGADGFGYVFDGAAHRKIPQVGGVIVEDDVEVGANVTIDRATVGVTRIGRGTKIDNLVQIGHNVQVGENALIVAQAGIAGSSRLGRGVVLAGQVGVADHVTVGDGAMAGAQSGIHADVPAGEKVLGTPARPLTQAKRVFLAESRLPELLRVVRGLERRLARLEGLPSPETASDDR
jgi:UDP-3-O-[3-hydroxymyristoyl] glucosamine N-acyltransferase